MGLMAILVIAVVVYYYHDFLAMSYDDEFARLRGVPVTFLYCLLLGMIAVTVVMIIRVVGLILVIALLTIPPFIAEKFTGSLKDDDGGLIGSERPVHSDRSMAFLPLESDLGRHDHPRCRSGFYHSGLMGEMEAAEVV